LQRVEGEPIDLRTDAVVTFHTEPVVWPEHLQAHADRISRDLKGFIDGYWRMRKAIGPDRPLSRHHIEIALLLAKYQELDYCDLELPQALPAEIVARFLSLVAEHDFDPKDGHLLWEVLTGSGHLSQKQLVSPGACFSQGATRVLAGDHPTGRSGMYSGSSRASDLAPEGGDPCGTMDLAHRR
jgi:hypothetical protein